ncbi:MAG: HypC/HybG/HupF family hydrogenase formation chaperone [Cyanobacteria bacterium K_DeepCast_35m_m2_023]|nr:HypC/HybG/HupF family hydrogenase formation chaperone [Cyanobacteria bacterium K_DeepCast_35m_m2_023]
MCLAATGTILCIETESPTTTVIHTGAMALWLRAQVDFGGVRQWVSLACLPEARVGDRVLVHVGLALSIVEEDER